MYFFKRVNHASTALFLCFALSACGSQTYGTAQNGTGTSSTGTTGTTSVTPTPTPTPTATTTPSAGVVALATDFSVQGNGSTYSTAMIKTDNMFRVTLSMTSPASISGTGYHPVFRCIQMKVKVGSITQTALLATGESSSTQYPYLNAYYNYNYTDPCAAAVSSSTLNFDSVAKVGQTGLNVTVTPSQTDNCRTIGSAGYLYTGCILNAVYSTYIYSGSLSVTVNGL